jgi:UbiD family decarboxylase
MQSIRTYIRRIEEAVPDQLVTVDGEVDSRYEITAYIQEMERRRENPGLLFSNVKGFDSPVAVNLFGHIDRMNLAIGDSEVRNGRLDFYDEWNASMAQEVLPVHVTDGPVKDVSHTGDDVDLTSLPVPLFYEQDGGRYITAGLMVARNPVSPEELNLTYARMVVNGKADLGVSFHSRGHMWHYFEDSKEAGEPLDVAIILGGQPALCLAAAAKITDEYDVASSLMGEPLELVGCETVDLPVPSQAEIILEGKVLLDEGSEGPFTEYTGYISGRSTRNHLRVDAITMREDAIFHAVSPNNAAEHLLLSGLPKQARISRSLIDSMHVSALRDIIWPVEGTHFVCFLTLDEKMSSTPGLAKQYALLLLGLDHYVKYVAILPEGTDITDIAATLGTFASRCDFRRGSGVELLGDIFGQYLDPSSPEAGLTSKMIVDATGPVIRGSGAPVEALKEKVVRIGGVEEVALHCGEALCFAAVKATPNAEASHILSEISEDFRLVAVVDGDIDVNDPREVLWAIATRSQPMPDVVLGDSRMVIDARKSPDWSAMRATLPESVRARVSRFLNKKK